MQWKGASFLPSQHKNIVCGYKHHVFHALQTDAEFRGNDKSIFALSNFLSRESKEERFSLKHNMSAVERVRFEFLALVSLGLNQGGLSFILCFGVIFLSPRIKIPAALLVSDDYGNYRF